MLAQTALEFNFTRNRIVLEKNHQDVTSFSVYNGEIKEDEILNATAIIGKTVVENNTFSFIPVIPFGWNQQYTILYDNILTYYTLPIPENYNHLSVEKIYPTNTAVPSNLLKWYIKFSKPINTASVYSHIKLLKNSGELVERAILPLENALISEDGTLLTIWIEPGRQKRNLIPNQQLGPVFNSNESYQLVISKTIKDRNGISMQDTVSHTFSITEADRIQPNIHNWILQIPNQNSVSNLVITSNESLDYGSTLNNITVFDDQNKIIRGVWSLSDAETNFSFTPNESWKKGNYQIVFNDVIEDLAGNSLHRLFDTDIDDHPNKKNTSKHQLEFDIK